MKAISILGKPNVGKSSLFNRLIKQQLAITSDKSGTTRDVNKAMCNISGIDVVLLDTGGIEKTASFSKQISQISLKTGIESDLVLYIVDGTLMPEDEDIYYIRVLQKAKKPIILIVNKVDNDKIKAQAYQYAVFGIENICFISVIHNRGLTILLKMIFDVLNLANAQSISTTIKEQTQIQEYLESTQIDSDNENKTIKVGIIGRVNVGKSSLLNALLGFERSIVSTTPGTTIDPVNESIEYKNKIIEFVDTAGIRRAGKIEGIEKFALMRTNDMLSKSHIAILVLDASGPFVELDEKISSLIPKYALGIIAVFNKWDKSCADFKHIKQMFAMRFRFLTFAPIIAISALNGHNITKLKDEIINIFNRLHFRIPTNALNECIAKAVKSHHIPSDKGKIVKIYYGVQYAICPPQIALISNRPESIHFSYKRYLINILRETFNFSGVPILLKIKDKNEQKNTKNVTNLIKNAKKSRTKAQYKKEK